MTLRLTSGPLVIILILSMLAASAQGDPAQSHTAARCEAAPVSSRVRTELEAAFRRSAHLPSSFRLRSSGALHYGSCGGTLYGFAELRTALGQTVTSAEAIELQDHSVLYVRSHGESWRNISLGPICAPGLLPAALAAKWHVSCSA
jgi:hypothetical protein